MAEVMSRPLLERVAASPINYWATFVTDLVVAASFAWFGATRHPGSAFGAAAFVLLGIAGWPLLEYSLHRWLLHGKLSAAFRKEHARHHAYPRETAGTPWLASTSLGIVFWACLAFVLSGSAAALFMSGIYAGYIYFVIVHRMQHYHPEVMGRWRLFGRQLRMHELHHAQPDMHFGITTSIWDHILGTFRGRSRLLEHDEVVMEQPRR